MTYSEILKVTQSLYQEADLRNSGFSFYWSEDVWESKPMKFKRGDRVRCIGPGVGCGYGWERDLEYIVTGVANMNMPCYFGGKDGNGVYEEHLELVTPGKEADMAVWEVGDQVRIIGPDTDEDWTFERGEIKEVEDVDTYDDTYYVDGWWYPMTSLEKISNNNAKEIKEVSDLYQKVVKETPELEEGAILRQYSANLYVPISDLWNKEEVDEQVQVKVPKKSPYFERVYAAEQDGRTVYVDKETARDLLNSSVTLKKDSK